MANITIRGIDESLKARLMTQAKRNGRSMEEEARGILRTALATRRKSTRKTTPGARRKKGSDESLFDAVRAIALKAGGFDDVMIPPREMGREPPRFD